MKFIALDPSIATYGVYMAEKNAGQKLRLIEGKTLKTKPGTDESLRAGTILAGLEDIIVTHLPDAAILERPVAHQYSRTGNKNAASIQLLNFAVGITLGVLHKHGIPTFYVASTDNKTDKKERVRYVELVHKIHVDNHQADCILMLECHAESIRQERGKVLA